MPRQALDSKDDHAPLATVAPATQLFRAHSWLIYPISVAVILGVNGYHPFSQDGGIYLPAVMQSIDPSRFATDGMFVAGHRHLSLFASVFGEMIRVSHVPQYVAFFALYILCAFAFVIGVSALARKLVRDEPDARTATLLAAAFFCLPAAGTSLMVMDPYVTARSITTPLLLFAVVAVMDRQFWKASLLCAISVSLHPIMGLCCCFTAIVLGLVQEQKKRILTWFLSVAGVGVIVAAIPLAALQSPVYLQAVSTRAYLSLAGWAWFETLGLLVPLTLLLFAVLRGGKTNSHKQAICETSLIVGLFSLPVSAILVHPDRPSLLLRMQPLRLFHTIYVLGLVLLSVWAVERFRKLPRVFPLVIAPAVLAVPMFFANAASYPEGRRFEISPEDYRVGSLSEALYWIGLHTPANAVFAADQSLWKAHNPEEDGFRAETGRSILLDDKDEGLVTVFPELANSWESRRIAQQGLAAAADAQRKKQLSPFGAQFVLLSPESTTQLSCPFRNRSVQVCTL